MASKTLTLDSSSLFLNSLNSTPSPLTPFPTDFPQSKRIPNSRFIVDGFRHAGDHSVSYFLSHFHSDHYTGLSPNWSKGIIYCSQITARLLVEVLKVPAAFVVSLPMSEIVVVDDCEVRLVDANHCPGAVQFLFKVRVSDGGFERYVHTGDFRYCDDMKLDDALCEFVGADVVYLDTTYCNPKFVFPVQDESVDYIVEAINRIGVENVDKSKSVLFLVATYVIGKERILVEIARRCNRKIHVDRRKMDILGVLGFGEDEVFTEDESESDVHVVGWNVLGETWPYFRPNFVMMNEIMAAKGYSKVVGFVPTGWTYEVKRNKFAVRTKDSFEIHLVPYSEHSNYEELREYVKFLKPKRVIPTVGVDVEKLDSKHALAMQKHFAGLVDEMAVKQDFLKSFHRGARNSSDKPTNVNTAGIEEKDLASDEVQTFENIDSELHDQAPVPQDILLVNDNDIEELVQELHDCLPAWVTRDQMLDLLQSSNKDVVEAVSYFYEHEIEFHEQAAASTSSLCKSQPGSESDSLFPLTPDTKAHDTRAEKSPLSLRFNSLGTKPAIKHDISPAKKKRNIKNKPSKRARTGSSKEATVPTQHTITKFFSKLVCPDPGADKLVNVCAKSDEENIMSQMDCPSPYKEELEQFMQIVDGSPSLRNYASHILDKSKGDISKALDIYYSDRDCSLDENKGKLTESSKSGTVQNHTGCCSSVQAPKETENLLKMDDVSAVIQPLNKAVSLVPEKDKVHISPREQPTDVASCLVSLPPQDYSPIEHACWKGGQPAPYLHLARTFDLVEEEKGKIKATLMLCNMFRSLLALSPEDVLPAVYLCTNKIAPDHENMELNIGGSIIVSALEETCGANKSKIRTMYNNLGDLGDVAQLCRQTQSLLATPAPLSIRGVFQALHKISIQTGNGSTSRKKGLIMNLMRSCREKEMKYLVRTLVRNLRIGAMMRTVLPALAQAVAMSSSPAERSTENTKQQYQALSAVVLEAYNVLPNLDLLIPSLMDHGIKFSSTTLSMVPGTPIKPMLAKITNGIPQVLKLFSCKAFSCEYKYDGQRAQIHKLGDGSVRVFSRNGDETTSRFPDLVNIIKESCSSEASSFVLDAEVVAVDRKNGCKLMSFQELSSRERGGKDSLIAVDNIKVDICVFAFDIMFANGEQLLSIPLRQRQTYLKKLFGNERAGYFEYARGLIVEADDAVMTNDETLTKMNSFLDDALRSSCEGIMVKSLDVEAGYTPSKRSDTWLKVKRDYVEGLNDTLDLVPIGAWHGNGRKAGWYSPFLVACYNPDLEEFQSVCRVMSGFSDPFYIEMKEFYSEDKILDKKPPYYQTGEKPDMWFNPELVWEIRGAEFSISPVHHAAIGLVHPSRGLSIRFPRFVRSRPDRKPEECSTAMDIAEMFNSQTRKMDVNVAE
ncbi:hypothetical protein DCAR_0729740 [Daucus carota subsp. sativus]|uniref:DNA ligase n=1 Tax=Daucus carota subsp. sativus TaxID=79200 RepID=A0AAF0XLJ7_DAUCS|nr:PREDICTED: DNA ligase 6 isoform X1 [Daucus carota subsp. sativus]WOH10273.1 hypothetical protein DCAR_0729740 [Daucus carota subsp. sativus]